MIKYVDILESFKIKLKDRFPENFNYKRRLARILDLHPKTISRKLRGETQFTLDEVVKIAVALNISLDNLYSERNMLKHPMEIYINDFFDKEEYPKMAEETLMAYVLASESKFSKYLVATNTLPNIVYVKYKRLARFRYLRWIYFNKGTRSMMPMSDIILNNDHDQYYQRYREALMMIGRSIYVFNINMMENAVDEVLFFLRQNLITKEDIKYMIDEYVLYLENFEEICQTSTLPGSDKEISFFVSDILLSNEITLINSDKIKFGAIYAFDLNPIITRSPEVFSLVESWFNSIIRSSTLISMSGEVQRSIFLNKQKEALNNLYSIL